MTYGLVVLGVVVGLLSGLLGVGGGVIVVPALGLLFGFTHQQATATSLGMLLLSPVGVGLAWLTYWRAGQADLASSGLLAAGFAVGAMLGGQLASAGLVSETHLRRGFAVLLLYVAASLLFRSDQTIWAATQTLALMAIYGVGYWLARRAGRVWHVAEGFDAASHFRELERSGQSGASDPARPARPPPIDYEI